MYQSKSILHIFRRSAKVLLKEKYDLSQFIQNPHKVFKNHTNSNIVDTLLINNMLIHKDQKWANGLISNQTAFQPNHHKFSLQHPAIFFILFRMKKSRQKNKQTPKRKDIEKLKEVNNNVLRDSTILPRATSNDKAASTRSKTIGNNHRSVQKLWSLTPDTKQKDKESPTKGFVMNTIYEKKALNKTKKKNKQIVVIKDDKQRDKNKEKPKEQDKEKEKQIKEKKKKQNYEVCLRQLKPLNLQKQKDIFFTLNGNYNPFFLYNNVNPMSQHDKDYKAFDKPHDKYLELAIKILQKSKKVQYCKKLKESPLLDVTETSKQFDEYIRLLQIQNLIVYEFMQHTVAPTSVIHNNNQGISKVIIGLPIQYRQCSIIGVLNHQIGTHFIRKFNNKLQKWHKERKKFGLEAFLKYQEGLAALNQLYQLASNPQSSVPPMLFPSALHYYSCYQASRMSFSELFEDLEKYQQDPELRWRECVRVKRGVADTGNHFGMYKDQIYLRGAAKILRDRNQLNMIDMHCGKLTLKDCIKMGQKKLINYQKTKLPYFLSDMKKYQMALDRIAEQNGVDEWWASRKAV